MRFARGFTLIEVMLALALAAVVLLTAFGALRIGASAWERAEARADAQHHERAILQLLERTVSSAAPYLAVPRGGDPGGMLFEGSSTRLAFATSSAPLPFEVPVAYAAVVIELTPEPRPGLAVRQRVLPAAEPFAPADPVLIDASVASLELRYRRDDGSWQDDWDARKEQGLPVAVEITLATGVPGTARAERPPLVIPIAVVKP
jgi:prepilin-type N-terminal cleavage/methylation domain-containing protein